MSTRWFKMTPSAYGHSPFQRGELVVTSELCEELWLPSLIGGVGGGLFQSNLSSNE
jgi:hypothetical protein